MSQRLKIALIIFLILILGAAGIILYRNFMATGETPPPASQSDENPFQEIPDVEEAEPAVNQPNISIPEDVVERAQVRVGELFDVENTILNFENVAPDNILAHIWLESEEGDTILRYIERTTGHVFDVNLSTGVGERVSNTTVPRLQVGEFVPGGGYLLTQRFDSSDGGVESLILRLRDTGSAQLIGVESIISDFAPLDSQTALGIVPRASGSRIMTIDLESGELETLADIPLAQVYLEPLSEQAALLLTRVVSGQEALAYAVSRDGEISRLLAGQALMARGQMSSMLFSDITDGSVETKIYEEGQITEISLPTFPSKCDFTSAQTAVVCGVPDNLADNVYPEGWLLGEESTNDIIWRYDRDTGNRQIVLIPEEEGEDIDVESLRVSINNQYASLIDKTDGSLWLLRL